MHTMEHGYFFLPVARDTFVSAGEAATSGSENAGLGLELGN